MKQFIVAAVLASSLGLCACEEKATPTSGGSQSLPGKVRDTGKAVVDKANEKAAEVGKAADKLADGVGDAFTELRNAALGEAEKKFTALKGKLAGLKDSNPTAFAAAEGIAKQIETKLGDLKNAGADKWKSLSEEITTLIGNLQKTIGG